MGELRDRRQVLNLTRRGNKRVEDAHVADVPAVLEILRNDFADAEALGIGPQVGIEPGQSVGRAAPQGGSQYICGRVEDGKLGGQRLGLQQGFRARQKRLTAPVRSWARHRSDEFDDGLLGQYQGIAAQPARVTSLSS